jgi:LDH2 family malate/lactate/ureidoglycolate dehydrogenase
MAQALEGAPAAPGVERVLLPGQPELLTAERRRRDGIPVAQDTWRQVLDVASELGVAIQEPSGV